MEIKVIREDGTEGSLSEISEETLIKAREASKIIRVPDGIKIVKNSGVLGIVNSKGQVLRKWFNHDTYSVLHLEGEIDVPCKLTPCERKDLKPGDLAYRSNYKLKFIEDLDQYVVILDGENYVVWREKTDARVFTCSFTYPWKSWYKVEAI